MTRRIRDFLAPLVFCVPTLSGFASTAFAGSVEFDLEWNGPNNFRLVGSFTFDETKLGQDIDEGDVLSFEIEGFDGATSIGEFAGTPTEFNFDSSRGAFEHPLTWNTAGPGIGFRTTQSTIGGSTSVNEAMLTNGSAVPGASRSFLFEPSVLGIQAPPTGQLPIHIYTLRIPPGSCPHPNPAITNCNNAGDTLPVGSGLFYTFALYDTGATTIAINSRGSIGQVSDSDLLNLCRPNGDCSTTGVDPFLPQSLDLRVWGLGATDPTTNGAPLDSPQAETRGLRVRTFAGPTLLGGPVTGRSIAMIDYTTEIERTFNFGQTFKVWAPDITFFNSRIGARLPILALELVLQRTGDFGTSPVDGASTGPRYLLRNMEIKHGAASIDDSSRQFLFDTANTVTQITHDAAVALGIDPDNDTPAHVRKIATVSGSVRVKGFVLDELSITSVFGDKYTVSSPLIYVRPPGNGLGGVDANVGSDMFGDTRIIFDGPSDRIWIPRENYPGPQEFVDNGDGTITDPTTGLMWLQDASYSATTGQGPNGDGKMPWADALAWADGLQFVGYDDWRLPTTLEPDPQCAPSTIPGVITLKNCRGAEMGYLYWGQGITAVTPGPFVNVPAAEYNWSATQHSTLALTWVHSFRHGEQGAGNNGPGVLLPAWPVRNVLPSDTNPGSDVEARPTNGVTVIFETVNAGGKTTAEESSTNPGTNPANFRFLGSFFDIETTASHSGTITVCFEYPPGTNTGTLEILHWDGSNWIPLSGAVIDATEMTICAQAPSLSWFAAAEKVGRPLWILILIAILLAVAA